MWPLQILWHFFDTSQMITQLCTSNKSYLPRKPSIWIEKNEKNQIYWFFFSYQRYPFDWRTPKGYAACMIDQSIFVYVLVKIYMCSLSSTIGHCVYTASFITDIEENLRELNEEFIGTNFIIMTFRKQREMCRKFTEIIEFYSNARK